MHKLNKIMAENKTHFDEYSKRTELRNARMDKANTITVAHPSDASTSSLDDRARFKTVHKLPVIASKNLLKDECMKFPQAIESFLGMDTLHHLATGRPKQQALVPEIKRVLKETLDRLKVDLENVFAAAETE